MLLHTHIYMNKCIGYDKERRPQTADLVQTRNLGHAHQFHIFMYLHVPFLIALRIVGLAQAHHNKSCHMTMQLENALTCSLAYAENVPMYLHMHCTHQLFT